MFDKVFGNAWDNMWRSDGNYNPIEPFLYNVVQTRFQFPGEILIQKDGLDVITRSKEMDKFEINMAGTDPKRVSVKINPNTNQLIVYLDDNVYKAFNLTNKHDSTTKTSTKWLHGLLTIEVSHSGLPVAKDLIEVPIGDHDGKQFLQE